MTSTQWTAIITALVPMVVALLAYLQVVLQQAQVNRNAQAVARHETQLDGILSARIQSAVDAGPHAPTQAQRDMPETAEPPKREEA